MVRPIAIGTIYGEVESGEGRAIVKGSVVFESRIRGDVRLCDVGPVPLKSIGDSCSPVDRDRDA